MRLVPSTSRGVLPICIIVAASVMAPPARALPSDPNNAALLYYQAFLIAGRLSDQAREHIANVANGSAPVDAEAREYIKKCDRTIEYAEAASRLRTCDWGFRYSLGFDALMPYLGQMRFLTNIILADARIRAADHDYRGAFEQCLMTDALARHAGDETLIAYLVSLAIRQGGATCLQATMGQAVDDPGLLQWLRDRLATYPSETTFNTQSLKIEEEVSLDLMRKENLGKLAQMLTDANDKKVTETLASVDEATLARARQVYSKCMASALAIMSTPMPYEQAYTQALHIGDGFDPNDPASVTTKFFTPLLPKVLTAKTKTAAYVRAAQVGANICLYRAQEGRLPDVLPPDLPKDPFSGKDFQYEKTKTGFTLRCQGKDLTNDKVCEFAFPVK